MELIDKNKITFEPIRVLNLDEHKHEITGMALFKDIEKIPIIKAIPLDKLREMCDEIRCLDGYDTTYKYVKIDKVIKIINKYIESEE